MIPLSLLWNLALVQSFSSTLSKRFRPCASRQWKHHRSNVHEMIPVAIVVDIYPYSMRDEIASKFPTSHKIVHMVRHAEGTHNVNEDYRSEQQLDARLTEKGVQQCEELAKQRWNSRDTTNVVITSTMTRCLQTALLSFPSMKTFVAHESLRETVNFVCDKRRSVTEIAKDFPMVDFTAVVDDEDPIWRAYEDRLGDVWEHPRESADLVNVAARGRTFFQFLRDSCPANEVVVCTHSAFLRCILNWGYGVPMKPPQTLGGEEEVHPVVRYCGDKEWEEQMRASYENCELRSMVVVFPLE